MKSRLLRATASTIFFGERGIISVKLNHAFCIFDGQSRRSISQVRTLANCQSGVQNSNMYISSEDDDFGELGSPVSHSGSKVPKLMTEKPEHFRRSDPTRKASTGTSFPRKRGKTLINFILESDNGDSALNSNDKNNCKEKRRSPIIIESVLTIRIKNINTETTDSAVHSKCKSYGPLNGLVRRQGDAVDVLFRVKDSSEAQSILRRLNGTKIDDRQWSACVLAKDDSVPEAMNNIEDANCKLKLQMSNRFAELRRQMNMKRLYSEDLEILHHALVHLECHPATISTT